MWIQIANGEDEERILEAGPHWKPEQECKTEAVQCSAVQEEGTALLSHQCPQPF